MSWTPPRLPMYGRLLVFFWWWLSELVPLCGMLLPALALDFLRSECFHPGLIVWSGDFYRLWTSGCLVWVCQVAPLPIRDALSIKWTPSLEKPHWLAVARRNGTSVWSCVGAAVSSLHTFEVCVLL